MKLGKTMCAVGAYLVIVAVAGFAVGAIRGTATALELAAASGLSMLCGLGLWRIGRRRIRQSHESVWREE